MEEEDSILSPAIFLEVNNGASKKLLDGCAWYMANRDLFIAKNWRMETDHLALKETVVVVIGLVLLTWKMAGPRLPSGINIF